MLDARWKYYSSIVAGRSRWSSHTRDSLAFLFKARRRHSRNEGRVQRVSSLSSRMSPATSSFIKPASINIRQNSTATRRPIEVMNVRTRLENKEFHARPRTCAPDARGFTRDMSDTRDVISIVRFDPPLLHALIAFYRADAITFERCVVHTKAGRQSHFNAPNIFWKCRIVPDITINIQAKILNDSLCDITFCNKGWIITYKRAYLRVVSMRRWE